MFGAIVPILYYSPSIINQIAIYNNKGLVVSQTVTKNTSRANSIKALIDKLFIPVGSETTFDNKKTNETQTNTQYDELFRAIQAVREAQKDSSCICEITQINENKLDTFILVDGEFKITTIKSKLDESMFITVESEFGEYKLKGETSINYWTSKSLLNHLVTYGKLTASAIVFPLSISESEKTIEAKFVCIFVT